MNQPFIHRLPMSPVDVNSYVAACPVTGACAVIDPGDDTDRILAVIDDNGYSPRYIINTHGHHDHVAGNAVLRAALGIPVARYPGAGGGPIDIPLTDGARLPLGELSFVVLYTPGHIPDAVCLLLAGHLFTGDTLFVGDAGRTDLAGGDFDRLIASLQRLAAEIPEDTVILPGHDYGSTPTSTMGREKRENPYITNP